MEQGIDGCQVHKWNSCRVLEAQRAGDAMYAVSDALQTVYVGPIGLSYDPFSYFETCHAKADVLDISPAHSHPIMCSFSGTIPIVVATSC
jgi:hypothetical protein